MSEVNREEGLFDGYRTQEQRDLAMLNAALYENPDYFGKMTPENKAEYKRLVKELKSLPEDVGVDVPFNMD